MIDRDQINIPSVSFTSTALEQVKLILLNDFTLNGKFFRLVVSGKGCDGFTYGVGFTGMNTEDILVPISKEPDLEVIMDPFTAFYLQDTIVDYQTDFENNNEGFVVINRRQKDFHGKFWKKDEEKLPPTHQNQ